MVLELEMPARPGQAFEGGLVCLRRPRPWALPQRAGLPPGAGAPLLLPGGVCRIVDFPYWLKGKVHVRSSVHPGRAGEEGRREGRPTSGPFLQEARRASMA